MNATAGKTMHVSAEAPKTAVIAQPRGVIADMAAQYRMDAVAFERTLRATVFPENGSKEQFAAFLMVAREYNLNPLTKQIYAFPDKKGGVVPIVPIDGWMAIVNSRPEFDGMEFVDRHGLDGEIAAITCRMYRKDRAHATEVTEYLSECKRTTEPWKQWPARMLRHKAAMQCARYAFSLSGIHDPDEGERIVAGEAAPQPQVERGAAGLKKALTTPAPAVADAEVVEQAPKAGKPQGAVVLRDELVKKFAACDDQEILDLVRDEANGYEWTAADQAVIDEAYRARSKEIGAK